MSYKRVAVVRGGPSEEYSVSLRTGGAVLKALKEIGYPHLDIVISRQGEWIVDGVVRLPQHALTAVDVVFVALHGSYGEDGKIQRLLERHQIPFTGSGSMASALAFNKHFTKKALTDHAILTPRHVTLDRDELNTSKKISLLFETVGSELLIKPVASGSSHGVRYVNSQDGLLDTLRELFRTYDLLLVEEYIRGREATVGIVEHFRDTPTYALPVIEIIPPHGEPLWNYKSKYNGETREICPGRFSYQERAKLQLAAAQAHAALNCTHYSRSDFIVSDNDIYFLEINTLPGLTDESLFPKASAAVGLSYNDLIVHLLETARV